MKLQKGNGWGYPGISGPTHCLTSCSRVAKALVYQPSGPGSIPGMFRLRCQLPPDVPFDLQSRHRIPGPQEVDVATELAQPLVDGEPCVAGAGVAAAVLTHGEAGGVSNGGVSNDGVSDDEQQ